MIKYVQTLTFSLSGSGANVTNTSIILKSFKDIDGNTLTMTDFGTIGFGTMEPGTVSQEEQISFTGVTANSNGTFTLTGVSHVLSKSPYTATSGLNISHNGGTDFVISNTVGFYNTFANKQNDETITGAWSLPIPTLGANPATKNYVDGIAIAGAPDATTTVKGVTRLSSSAAVSLGDFTVTIASPAVLTTVTPHGLTVNDTVVLSTTGALPTGLVAGTTYFVITAGLTTNNFQASSDQGRQSTGWFAACRR